MRAGKLWSMLAAAWLSWSMAISELANSWWGTTQRLSLAGGQAGATGDEPWQEWGLSPAKWWGSQAGTRP